MLSLLLSSSDSQVKLHSVPHIHSQSHVYSHFFPFSLSLLSAASLTTAQQDTYSLSLEIP